jgi:hypothetical protein
MAAIFLRAKMPRGQARRLTNRRRSGKAAAMYAPHDQTGKNSLPPFHETMAKPLQLTLAERAFTI